MRALAAFVSLTLACSAIALHPIAAPGADGLPAAPAPVPLQVPPSPEAPAPPPPETPAPPLSSPERIATDTPKTTVLGNTFVAPAPPAQRPAAGDVRGQEGARSRRGADRQADRFRRDRAEADRRARCLHRPSSGR